MTGHQTTGIDFRTNEPGPLRRVEWAGRFGKLGAAVLLSSALFATSCATPTPPVLAEPGLVPTESRRGVLFVKPDHNVGAYDQTLYPPIEITNRSGRQGLREREAQALSRGLGQRIRGRTIAGGLGVAEEPGVCAMTMDFEIKDVEVAGLMSEIRSGSSTTFIDSMGAVTLEVVLRDSLTDTPLVQFRDRRRLPGGQIAGSARGALLAALEETLDVILADFAMDLRVLIPQSTVQKPLGPECKGRIRSASQAANN